MEEPLEALEGFSLLGGAMTHQFFRHRQGKMKKKKDEEKKGGKKRVAEVNKERDEPVNEQVFVNTLCGRRWRGNTSSSSTLKSIDHRICALQDCFAVLLVLLPLC